MRDIGPSAETPAPTRTGTPRELHENTLSVRHQMKRVITDGYWLSASTCQPSRGGSMAVGHRPGESWAAVLRRQPARVVEDGPEGGYTDMFEIICGDCGDDPRLDYLEVSPRLQLVRGPYPIALGVAVYEQHVDLHGCRTAPAAGAGER
jgi:hypothetical protein